MSLINDLHEIETDINIIRQKVGLPASATLANIAQAVGTGGSSLPTFYHFNSITERDQATAGLKDGDVAFVYGEKQNADLLPSMVGAIVTNIKLPLEIRNISNYTINTGTITLESISDNTENISIQRTADSILINIRGRDLVQSAGGGTIVSEYGSLYLNYHFNNISNSFRLNQLTEQNYGVYEHHELKNDYFVQRSTGNLRNEDFIGFNVFDIKDVEGLYELNQGNWEPFDLKVNASTSQIFANARAFTNNGIIYGAGEPTTPGKIASKYYQTLSSSPVIDLSHAFDGMAFDINPLVNRVSTNKITNMSYCFNGCYTVTSIPNTTNWDTSEVKDMSYCFNACVNLTTTDTATWNTSSVENLSHFAASIRGISNWWNGLNNFNTENVRDMSYCFNSSNNLQVLRLNNWTTPNVTNMSYMFSHLNKLTTLHIPLFNTHNVTNMNHIFYNTGALNVFDKFRYFDKTSLEDASSALSYIVINANVAWKNPNMIDLYMPNVKNLSTFISSSQYINSINLRNIYCPNVTNLDGFINSSQNLVSVDITGLDFNNVQSMNYFFSSCPNLTNIIGMDNISTPNLKVISSLFMGCNISLTPFATNIITNLNTNNLETISGLIAYNANGLDINLSHWNTDKVTSIGSLITWAPQNQPNSLNLSGWNTSNLKSLYNAFNNMQHPININGWDTSNVSNFGYSLSNCNLDYMYDMLNTLNFSNADQLGYLFSTSTFSNFDISSLQGLNQTTHPVDMRHIFRRCSSLTEVNLSGIENVEIERLDSAFFTCSKLTNVIGLNSLNTDNCYFMNALFSGCYNIADDVVNQFTELNLEKIECLNLSFNGCRNITTFNMPNKNIPDCATVQSMFYGCYNLTTVNLENTLLGDYCNLTSVFNLCNNLTNINLNFREEVHVTSIVSMFNNCQKLTSIDLSKINLSNSIGLERAFQNAVSLTDVEIPHTIFNTEGSVYFTNAFSNCQSLTNLNLSNLVCNTSYTTQVANMFYNCNSYVSTHLEDICDFVMRFNVPVEYRNISNTNVNSPIYGTNVQVNSSTVSAETLSRLSLMGWTIS